MLKFLIAARGQTRRRPHSVPGALRAIARVATIAGLVFGFGVVSAPVRAQIQITDIADLGNEVAERVNSVSHVLNGRSCLTSEEKTRLVEYLNSLQEQLFKDLQRVLATGSPSKDIEQRANARAPLSAVDRADLRLRNLQHNIERLTGEILHYPICAPGTYPQIGFFIGGHFIKLTGDVKSTERLDATDQVTNQFSDRKDRRGRRLDRWSQIHAVGK